MHFGHWPRIGDVRVKAEKTAAGTRWEIETTGAIDRALASLIVAAVVAVLQLSGIAPSIYRFVLSLV